MESEKGVAKGMPGHKGQGQDSYLGIYDSKAHPHNLDITLPPHGHVVPVSGTTVWAAYVTVCQLTLLAP